MYNITEDSPLPISSKSRGSVPISFRPCRFQAWHFGGRTITFVADSPNEIDTIGESSKSVGLEEARTIFTAFSNTNCRQTNLGPQCLQAVVLDDIYRIEKRAANSKNYIPSINGTKREGPPLFIPV